jgi:nickel-dependent lactate racemase
LYLGTTTRGTPVWINRLFAQSDLKIVVGNLEPHQFQGFSGGVKGAAIGLAGRETIDANHSWMLDPRARIGRYTDNPARQDVEEIGRLAGVDFALNVLLNAEQEIVQAIAGEPQSVMEAGIRSCRELWQVPVDAAFDLVISSPGGYPKDLNLYQSQKAFAHAGLIMRKGGTVILVAACPDGTGSRAYEAWMAGMRSHGEILARFERESFRVGPHKAYLIARDACQVRPILVSALDSIQVRRLLFTPAATIDAALEHVLPGLPSGGRIGILPKASSTIPYIAK